MSPSQCHLILEPLYVEKMSGDRRGLPDIVCCRGCLEMASASAPSLRMQVTSLCLSPDEETRARLYKGPRWCGFSTLL